MIELHCDNEPHVPETDGRRPSLVRIARVNRLHLEMKLPRPAAIAIVYVALIAVLALLKAFVWK